MLPTDVQVFIIDLEKAGLRYAVDGRCADIVVVDQLRGTLFPCDWIESDLDEDGRRIAFLKGTPRGKMAVPVNWDPSAKLFHADALPSDSTIDPRTGQEVFLDSAGQKRFLGRAFDDENPKASLLLARPRLLREACRATYNSLLERGWLAISLDLDSPDPDFHLAMRYENQLGLIFVEAMWGETQLSELSGVRKARLLARAKHVRALPILARCSIVAPIKIRPLSESTKPEGGMTLNVQSGGLEVMTPSVGLPRLENLITKMPLSEKELDLRERIEISNWELQDFAVQIVRDTLAKEGFIIEHWSSRDSADPHITARKDTELFRIVVGSAAFPVFAPIFDQNRLMVAAERALVDGGIVAKCAVSIGNATDTFSGDGSRALFRGEGAFAKFEGIERVDPVEALSSRSVRIFVSSTFNDFEEERTELAGHVVPELQRRAAPRGVSVSLIDLRWGVTRADLARLIHDGRSTGLADVA
jgi:hypothetical protein